MKILTMLEILRNNGYTKKQIKQFYAKKERLSKMNVRYTIAEWEEEISKKN